MTITKLRPEPPRPEITPRRAELASVKAEIRDLRRTQATLAAPNPRLDAILQAEQNAQAALAAVDEAERADLRRFIEHGGSAPQPRTDERRRAQAALTVAKNAGDVARSVEAERQSKLEAVNREIGAANKRMRDAITTIITEEAFPATLRRYVAAVVAVNAEWQGVLAVSDLLVANGRGGMVTPNVFALPRAIACPTEQTWKLPEGQTVIDVKEMQAAARTRLEAFVAELAGDEPSMPDAA